MNPLPTRFEDVEALEDFMSEPTPGLVADLTRVDGDLIVIGVGGKMGPTLARMARRALEGTSRRVIAVSRFGSGDVAAASSTTSTPDHWEECFQGCKRLLGVYDASFRATRPT